MTCFSPTVIKLLFLKIPAKVRLIPVSASILKIPSMSFILPPGTLQKYGRRLLFGAARYCVKSRSDLCSEHCQDSDEGLANDFLSDISLLDVLLVKTFEPCVDPR